MKPLPSCSLIVSTYNWPQALELVLMALRRQTHLPLEVIIADDGSGPETRNLIESFRATFPVPLVHVWHEDEGFRKTIILNKAIARTKGEYIVTIDGDIITEKHFVQDHLELCEPNTFIYGKRVKIQQSHLKKLFKQKQIDFSFFSAGIKKRSRALRIPFLARRYRASDYRHVAVRGCNLSFWRSDFIKVNGYNEDMTGWGKEDTELTIRFFNNGLMGKNVKYGAVACHIYHPDASRERDEINASIQKETIDKHIKVTGRGVSQYL